MGAPFGKENHNWRGGIANYPQYYIMRKVRLEKLQEQNYKCELCGKPTKEIHHKDLSRTNHHKDNMVVVCHSCHINKFHSVNHGKSRKFNLTERREILDLYLGDKKIVGEIAHLKKCSRMTIKRVLVKCGINKRELGSFSK